MVCHFDSSKVSGCIDGLSVVLRKDSQFMTSLNIIGEVMNVPLPALECIWRKSGEEDIDPSSLCIDEERLELFADAYIRKMKNYFESSVHNVDYLSVGEETDLIEFFNQFKSNDTEFTRNAHWSQINTKKLHDSFFKIVKQNTYEEIEDKSFLFAGVSLDVVNRVIKFLFDEVGSNVEDNTYSIKIRERYLIALKRDWSKEKKLLQRISHSRLYSHKKVEKKETFQHPILVVLRKFYLSARYYYFASDDNDPYLIIA